MSLRTCSTASDVKQVLPCNAEEAYLSKTLSVDVVDLHNIVLGTSNAPGFMSVVVDLHIIDLGTTNAPGFTPQVQPCDHQKLHV